MPERPDAPDGLLAHVADNLPDETSSALVGLAEDESTTGSLTEAYPPKTHYVAQVLEHDGWASLTYPRTTLAEARQRRDAYRARFPNLRFRIVSRTKTSVVVESDEVEQGGGQPS